MLRVHRESCTPIRKNWGRPRPSTMWTGGSVDRRERKEDCFFYFIVFSDLQDTARDSDLDENKVFATTKRYVASRVSYRLEEKAFGICVIS